MAFETIASLAGSPDSYQMSPTVKKYTVRDNGFEETSSGNFQFIRPLDASPENKQGIKLKIVISRDLTQLKISTTTSNGLRAVNLFKGDAFKMSIDKYNFIMAGLVERGVLEKAE
ncbi:cysteine desulfurase [Carnobacterium divergens]|uniref:DUF1831 domain-containing protein n=1 Tax=Carnobacterium divergens TaxID=2748 RepID=UPI00107191E3|nr:DUF1831 domain-containing protein [Carnobacterium divergens]MDT1996523.1 DUF1831 domain-containing protein [Carnobacterium divergens]TFI62858.1 cysteine desulfurase [Carnobacterium divergens]TFI63210.1 cysteine desulfurase [Carnobacterium divergens]TFI66606.1 cysteine desulfurase [Carnobacterium divergens]TFI78203.1 cysteine desulfurase [Carnobacterium divergens]